MNKVNKREDGGIEAPPPEGGWASLLEGEEDDDNEEDRVKVDATIDEECMSDDDMPRGRTFRFTPAGEAALAVDTAAGSGAHSGGSEKTVGLRRRGEGARWDSAALGLGHRGLPKRYSKATAGGKDSHVWTPLTNPAEMEFYRFAVASDPGESLFASRDRICLFWLLLDVEEGHESLSLSPKFRPLTAKSQWPIPLSHVRKYVALVLSCVLSMSPNQPVSRAKMNLLAVALFVCCKRPGFCCRCLGQLLF